MCAQSSFGQIVVPKMGDMNGNGESDAVDVQFSIQAAQGLPLSPLLDEDEDGVIDGSSD